MKFLRNGQDIDDPHYQSTPSVNFRSHFINLYKSLEMKAYKEVPQWWYISLFVVSLGVAIGCLYGAGTKEPLMPWWSTIVFTLLAGFLAIFLGFSKSFHLNDPARLHTN